MALQSTLSHKSTHASGGTDAFAPADIGAEPTITTLPLSKGGTGSTTAANALTALGAVAKAGDTMTGKLNLPASTTAEAGLNIGNGVNPTSPVTGDTWISTADNLLKWRAASTTISAAASNLANSFSVNQTIQTSTLSTVPALRVTQRGTGEALRVEDDTSPDTTAFVISSDGRVGVGVTPDATVAISVDTTGIKFGDGTLQTTAAGAHKSTHASGGTDALTPADIGAESTITTLPISKGGTGSTTSADALTALGAVAKSGDTMTGVLTMDADVQMLPSWGIYAGDPEDPEATNTQILHSGINLFNGAGISFGGVGDALARANLRAQIGAVGSNTATAGGGTQLLNMVQITSAVYGGITPAANTLYIIVG